MTPETIALRRLASQQIAHPTFDAPGEVVRRLGAVQAQDYLGALWAVGLRTRGATERSVEQALEARAIVRTWPMRGTLHFVPPADVRWMLELLTPRVVQRSAARLRQLGLDAPTIAASAEVLVRALEGGRRLTRPAVFAALESAGIATGGQRGYHILTQLAYERLICFGPRDGRQPTFTLLDEWAPSARSLPRDEALATLALRYFTGHGPATLQDFMWWSGLTAADARAGSGAAATQLERAVVEGREYYFAGDAAHTPEDAPGAFLLPPFDEYLVGYRDRSAMLDQRHAPMVVPSANGVFNPIVVIGGRVVGSWKRTLQKDTVAITFSPFAALDEAQARTLADAAGRYGDFLGKRVVRGG
ncbi:MAG TPA: winged helix DNA-binding domain-containing protein [Roseiflexaceae bacterium]|nr:winged helix DNA-binding domain-containing protein [Roseiflexaceae bacterium]